MVAPNEVVAVEIKKFLHAVLDALPESCKVETEEGSYSRRNDRYISGVGVSRSDVEFKWLVCAFLYIERKYPSVHVLGSMRSPAWVGLVEQKWQIPFDEDLMDYVDPIVQWIKGRAGYTESRKIK